MPGELPNVTTADRYTAANTVTHPPARRLRLIVRNASIAYRLAYSDRPGGGPADFEKYPERPLPPGNYPFDESHEPFAGIQVRSLTPGKPAQVIADAIWSSP
ncbi:MAG: hypothetical protein ACJ768_09350 [Gaiellaceae bacterium]